MAADKEDHYKTLELNSKASLEEIKKAYRRLALKYHPDKNNSNETEATKNFTRMKAAYEILGDTEKKKQYDNTRTFTPRWSWHPKARAPPHTGTGSVPAPEIPRPFDPSYRHRPKYPSQTTFGQARPPSHTGTDSVPVPETPRSFNSSYIPRYKYHSQTPFRQARAPSHTGTGSAPAPETPRPFNPSYRHRPKYPSQTTFGQARPPSHTGTDSVPVPEIPRPFNPSHLPRYKHPSQTPFREARASFTSAKGSVPADVKDEERAKIVSYSESTTKSHIFVEDPNHETDNMSRSRHYQSPTVQHYTSSDSSNDDLNNTSTETSNMEPAATEEYEDMMELDTTTNPSTGNNILFTEHLLSSRCTASSLPMESAFPNEDFKLPLRPLCFTDLIWEEYLKRFTNCQADWRGAIANKREPLELFMKGLEIMVQYSEIMSEFANERRKLTSINMPQL